jgi:fluoride exporter
MSAETLAAVVVLSGTGAVLRYLVDALATVRTGGGFPLGTLVVNVSGAFALGVIAGLALSHDAALIAGTAAVGSYTTFSTWMGETHRLATAGQRRAAAANVAVGLGLGLAAVALGRLLGGWL